MALNGKRSYQTSPRKRGRLGGSGGSKAKAAKPVARKVAYCKKSTSASEVIMARHSKLSNARIKELVERMGF